MFYVRPRDYRPDKPQTNKDDHYEIKYPPILIDVEPTYICQQIKKRHNKSQSECGNNLDM